MLTTDLVETMDRYGKSTDLLKGIGIKCWVAEVRRVMLLGKSLS